MYVDLSKCQNVKRVVVITVLFYHWCEVRMKMYVMNIGRSSKTSTIPRLNEEAAIDLGANLLGEGIIFGIALGILGYEVFRQKEKERKKEQEESAFMSSLENRITELAFANQELGSKIQELTSAVYHTQQELHTLRMSGRLQPKPNGSVLPGSDTGTRSLAECKPKISA